MSASGKGFGMSLRRCHEATKGLFFLLFFSFNKIGNELRVGVSQELFAGALTGIVVKPFLKES